MNLRRSLVVLFIFLIVLVGIGQASAALQELEPHPLERRT